MRSFVMLVCRFCLGCFMSKQQFFDVVIVGDGPVGLTCALLFAQMTPAKVAVIGQGSKAQAAAQAGRVSSINPSSMRLLKWLGLWADLVDDAGCFEKIHVYTQGVQPALSFTAQDAQVASLGYVIAHQLLLERLSIRLAHHDAVTLFTDSAKAWDSKRCHLTLSTGQLLKTTLLVGADGAQSFVRAQAGIAQTSTECMQHAFVGALKVTKGHQNSCYQRFCATGPLALLPLKDPCLVSSVWSLDNSVYQQVQQLPLQRQVQRLAHELAVPALGAIRGLGPWKSFPLVQRQADVYAKAHVALLGDAAHGIYPLAGMGLNMGLLDAATLVTCLQKQVLADYGALTSVLPYDRARRGNHALVLQAMRQLNTLFVAQQGPWANVRGIALRSLNRCSFAKRGLIAVASGAVFREVPRMMQALE
jgi:2-polyprenylphenol 6-hydroxylase